jgi:uncharacterized protein YkwD
MLGATVAVLSVGLRHPASAQSLTAASHQPESPTFGTSALEPDPRRSIAPRSTGPAADPSSPSSSPSSTGQTGSRPVPVAAAAPPSIVVNSTQQALINADRARYGLAPLTWSSCLYGVARGQAAYLASPGVAFQHYGGVQQDLSCHLGPQVGENIGWWSGGINDSQLNTMFMNSPEHKANILGPYRYVATAWAVRSDGHAYIAVEFG